MKWHKKNSRIKKPYLAILVSMVLLFLFPKTVFSSDSVQREQSQHLELADKIKLSNHAEFLSLLHKLSTHQSQLTSEQQLYLDYLKAWELTYEGNYEKSIAQLDAIISKSNKPTLIFRANITAISVLAVGTHYVDAFSRLSDVLKQLPDIKNTVARRHGLAVASQLYIDAGDYKLAEFYSQKLMKEDPSSEGQCNGFYYSIDSLFRSNNLHSSDRQISDGINSCLKAKEPLFADGIRVRWASLYNDENHPKDAIQLLQGSFDEVRKSQYRRMISQFDLLLAQAYWKMKKSSLAIKFAHESIKNSVKKEYTEPLIDAYELLYMIAAKQGHIRDALAYHIKYTTASKGYLSEVSARTLAYETVKQQVLAKKQQIDELSKQNQILQLQRALDKKAAETNRLYILLLSLIVAGFALLAYRFKRTQLHFKRMAHYDGLTGVYNRQYFVYAVTQQLEFCRKAGRDACLVLLDMDHFKPINDEHGHAVGDLVLQSAVKACQTHLRSTDILGRLGGEEFGILMPACSLSQGTSRIEQIRAAIAACSGDRRMASVTVSASFGIAHTNVHGFELRALLVHADAALYRAKRDGRNRVCIAVDEGEPCFTSELDRPDTPGLTTSLQ